MTDPIEIEDSPERIADRGADQLGYVGPTAHDLADPEEVVSLYSAFMSEVVALRTKAMKGQAVDVEKALGAITDRYAGIFLGHDSAFTVPAWNSPEQLGEAMKRSLNVPDDTAEEAMDAYWHIQAAEVVKAMADHGDGTDSDAAAQFRLDALREGALEALMGARTNRDL